jgi:tetratricopeptide (TPR) repeat protein
LSISVDPGDTTAVRRIWTRPVLIITAAAAALLGAGVALGPLRHHGATSTSALAPPQSPTRALDDFVTKTTAHLTRVPGDWQSWAQLAMAQIQLARITYDPSHYPLAQTALDESLKVRPKDNAAAQTGLGALAAARHDFRAALTYARRAVAADSYSADAYGVLTDANVELGQYPAATEAVQHMLDLRPDVGSYSRASYLFELRGDLPRATELMQKARGVASDPADITFTLMHLGELAFGAGNLPTAAARYAEGLDRQPGQAALLADRAKVEAARGDLTTAVTDLRAATATLPTVDHLATLADTLTAAGDPAGAARADDLIRVSTRLPGATPASTDIDLILFYADRAQAAAGARSAAGAGSAAGARSAAGASSAGGARSAAGASSAGGAGASSPSGSAESADAGLADARTAVAKGTALLAARPSVSVETAFGWALHAAGRDRAALVHADRGLRLGTRDAKAYYYRGMIKLALGDRSGARTDLAEAIKINPYFSLRYAPAARTALAQLGGAS